jgi:hypothetical protein
VPGSAPVIPSTCARAFATTLSHTSFITGLLLEMMELLGVSIDDVIVNAPSTSCSQATLAAGQGCLMQATEPVSRTTLQFAMDNCPDTSLPYLSLSCSGGYCGTLFTPCVSGSSECGTNLVCRTDLVTAADVVQTLVDWNVFDTVAQSGAGTCGGNTGVFNKLMNLGRSLFGLPAAASSAVMGFCLPSDSVW